MPLQATSGAASQDAFGGNGVAVVPTYIEDVFSTYLFLGTQTTTTITNGIDLSGKGGLVWLKDRTAGGYHNLGDTARSGNVLYSNTTDAQSTVYPFAFTSTGFTLDGNLLDSGRNFVTWTFRKQPKFFDVQTWTGSGANRTISHSLGSVPGCIIVKRTDTPNNWQVYHGSLANTEYLVLNSTAAKATDATRWNSTTPTSTVFSLGTDASVNASGGTYVAYLFAHDAGGFGLTGTDNVISCGSYTYAGAPIDITLGYEPQWVLIKNTSRADDWLLSDSMRGMPVVGSAVQKVYPNTSGAEAAGTGGAHANATGFTHTGLGVSGDVWIYIAIRRGPMKVPTTGTSVFAPIARTGNDTETKVTGVGFSPDLWMAKSRNISADFPFFDRLRGVTKRVVSNSTYLEESFSGSNGLVSLDMDGITIGAGATDGGICNDTGTNYANLLFKRAPSFMDIVCYTGTGSTRTVSHNLAAVPQLMITKVRSSAGYGWFVYPLDPTKYMELNSTSGTGVTSSAWNDTAPTASVFTVGPADQTNLSGATMVAYLFATCAGVSKVFSYTGNGSSQTINCGFTTGARFVLIKRTGSTGDWYVWDTARGIVAGNDPHLSLNTTAAEVTTDDTIDTDNTGFVVNQVTATNVNVSSATYIGLAVA